MSAHEHDVGPDEIRGWIEGRASAADRARLEAAITRDPELAALASRMSSVWAATEVGLGVTPAARITFDDLLQRAEPRPTPAWRRRAAAAAAVILCIAAAFGAWHFATRGSDAAPVVLQTIPSLDASTGEEAAAPRVPELLANWSPVQDGQIRWLDSWSDARAVSAATGRPIFVYGFIETCPICRGFQANEFKDQDVLAWVDRTVPLAIDLMKLDEGEMEVLWSRRYPLLELQDDAGRIVRTFAGTFGDVDMPTEFANAVKDIGVPDWKSMREATVNLFDAQRAAERAAFGEATQLYGSLTARADLPAWAEDARRGSRRIDRAAAQLVASFARTSDSGALARFEREADSFRGTRHEADLSAVARAWRREGRFPELANGDGGTR